MLYLLKRLIVLKPKNGVILPKFFGFTTISPFKSYNFLLKTLFSRLRVRNKSPFDGLTIRSSIRMLQTDFRLCRSGIHARMVYKREWSICRPLATRFLAVYWLKKSFLSKAKGMNDRGISPYVLEFLNF